MFIAPRTNININFGRGCGGPQGPFGGQQGCGPRGGHQMMRMMGMMLKIMGAMMGQGQQGGCCCSCNSRPSFGQGLGFPGGGLHLQMGASIRGFLG